MSVTALFDHALALHRQAPDSSLPRDGEPYPDDEQHRGPRPRRPREVGLIGFDSALVLRAYFANPGAPPSDLVNAFHEADVPIHPNEHIAAAARTADPIRVRATGRWLVRHSTDRCSALVGLALLAVAGAVEDTPLIQTIGLLSDKFGPLAAKALERQENGTAALIWLADRVGGWGRVYVVEALCRLADPAARPWLLRRPVDGDFLNGYFAGEVAEVSRLHESIVDPSADDDLVDHAGRLLHILAGGQGMVGKTLTDYLHADSVLRAHVRHLGRQEPTARRFATAAMLADYLRGKPAGSHLHDLGDAYAAILDCDGWCEAIRRAVTDGDEHLHPDYLHWLATAVGPRAGLRAFIDLHRTDEK